jgi:hypothetical protein
MSTFRSYPRAHLLKTVVALSGSLQHETPQQNPRLLIGGLGRRSAAALLFGPQIRSSSSCLCRRCPGPSDPAASGASATVRTAHGGIWRARFQGAGADPEAGKSTSAARRVDG